ncbi:hypothetical protein HC891_06245 [Candidatus Gracilibacteria bacterium]|nr:hypothetical protein [Candidatus Gracilibacteria bacterium]
MSGCVWRSGRFKSNLHHQVGAGGGAADVEIALALEAQRQLDLGVLHIHLFAQLLQGAEHRATGALH